MSTDNTENIENMKLVEEIKDWIEGSKLFKELKENPKDKKVVEKLHELYRVNPVEFIKQMIEAAHDLGDHTEETETENDYSGEFRQTWENTIHKERVQPLQYLLPKTCEELIALVKKAEADGLMVRAVGKGHSFSDVANATDVLVDMLALKKVLPVEEDTLKPSQGLLFNTEAGILVEDLNTALDKVGLAIPTMAAFDQETIYGAIATSTHGTGIRVEGMSNMLKSMDLVSDGGKRYRLEPSNGITDADKFAQKYPNGEITLIQDDDKFHSSVVSFGLMGIVYSIVIAPRKQFYLKQRLWLTNWESVKPKLADRSFFSEIDPSGTPVRKDSDGNDLPTRAQVFINPYKAKRLWSEEKDHLCVVQIQTEITEEEYEKLKKEEPNTEVKKVEDFVKTFISNGAYGVHESTIASEDKEVEIEEITVAMMLVLMNTHPELTPLFLEISLLVLLSGSGKIGKGYVVMNQGKLAIKNAGYSVEPGFGVDPQNNFIEGIEEIFAVADLSRPSVSYLTSPICARFVKASKDYMSPEYSPFPSLEADGYNGATCMIDVPMLLGSIGDDQMLDRMQRNLIEHGAKPHWGKICNMVNGRTLIETMYPKFDEFLEAVDFFDPKGTFKGAFSYRTSISQLQFSRETEPVEVPA